ncbi:secreted protein [Beggiatoa sp. PS]|nr:secreted protein [Beggiatoa sp. PS]
MKNLGKLSFIVVSYLLLQNPAIATDDIEIKQQGNNIIITKNGQQKIIKDIPKQDGMLSLRETLETIKKILKPGDKRSGHSDQSTTTDVNKLDISIAEKFHFCYVASKPITLWHPDKQRNTNRLTLQQDGGKTVNKRWKPGQYFDWNSDILPIENGATYTITIGSYSPRVTLHQVSDNVISNDKGENFKIGEEMATQECGRQALLFMPHEAQTMFNN